MSGRLSEENFRREETVLCIWKHTLEGGNQEKIFFEDRGHPKGPPVETEGVFQESKTRP